MQIKRDSLLGQTTWTKENTNQRTGLAENPGTSPWIQRTSNRFMGKGELTQLGLCTAGETQHRQLFPTAVFPSKRTWEQSLQGKTSPAPKLGSWREGHLLLWQDSLTTLLRGCGRLGCSRLPRTETNKQKKGFFSCFTILYLVKNLIFRPDAHGGWQ